jgi:hypothetical protein
MFTSCGWFFDDIAGIEALQVLRYAARAIDLAGTEAHRLEAGLMDLLAAAESAQAGAGNGRDLYLASVKPKVPAEARVAAGAVAARRLAPDVEPARGAFHVRDHPDHITVTNGRTEREMAYRVTFNRPTGARLALDVYSTPTAGGDLVARLELDGLPEPYRFPVVAALRAEVIQRRLTPEERAQIANGSAEAAAVVARALVRAVSALGRDHSAAAVAAVIDLADVLELYGRTVPFDAQTTFARIRTTASPQVTSALTPVAARLGFTTEG